jgi:hypothetical protein
MDAAPGDADIGEPDGAEPTGARGLSRPASSRSAGQPSSSRSRGFHRARRPYRSARCDPGCGLRRRRGGNPTGRTTGARGLRTRPRRREGPGNHRARVRAASIAHDARIGCGRGCGLGRCRRGDHRRARRVALGLVVAKGRATIELAFARPPSRTTPISLGAMGREPRRRRREPRARVASRARPRRREGPGNHRARVRAASIAHDARIARRNAVVDAASGDAGGGARRAEPPARAVAFGLVVAKGQATIELAFARLPSRTTPISLRSVRSWMRPQAIPRGEPDGQNPPARLTPAHSASSSRRAG